MSVKTSSYLRAFTRGKMLIVEPFFIVDFDHCTDLLVTTDHYFRGLSKVLVEKLTSL